MGQMRGCGEVRTEECSGHKALRKAESHSPLSRDYCLFKRDRLTGLSRVLLSLCDTFAFQKQCPMPCLPPHPMARDGFTAEGSRAMRQHSQRGVKRETCAFPCTSHPSYDPHPQHPPQAPLLQENITPELSLPPGISQLTGRGWDKGSLWISVRTEHSLPLMPCDGETK